MRYRSLKAQGKKPEAAKGAEPKGPYGGRTAPGVGLDPKTFEELAASSKRPPTGAQRYAARYGGFVWQR